jgi:predicted Zn-dependent protease
VQTASERGACYEEASRAYAAADYPLAESLSASDLCTVADGAARLRLWIIHVRAVANQGRLHEAGEICARALETHALDAELHYLHGILLGQAGWDADAALAARRAIYVDKGFVMGHVLLGDTLMRTGDRRGARIAFDNVLRLLAGVDASANIPAADGVPAARLRQIAEMRVKSLAPVARA